MRRIGTSLALALVLVAQPGCAANRQNAVFPREWADLPGAVLAIVWKESGASLAELDPISLQPAGRRIRLDPFGGGWSFSPDRSQLALGGGGVPSLHLVVLTSLRSRATLRLGARGSVAAVSWPRPDRVLATVEWGAFGHAVVVVDPLRGRVLARHGLPGTIAAQASAGAGIVFLLGPASSIGPSRLVAVDADGAMRSAALDRVLAGLLPGGDTGGLVSRYRYPGLAVSPDGRRAVVVDPAGLVAEVELDSMAVRYRELREPISLLGRLRNWLEPPAQAKAADGPARHAVWLDDHLLAVSGMDARASVGASGSVDERDSPAGLRLIDTRIWTVRTLDPAASAITVAGELVLAYGVIWDGSGQRSTGPGLTAYNRDGDRRFRVFAGEPVSWVQTAGRYAYAVVEKGGHVLDSHLYVVDLVSGTVLRALEAYKDAVAPLILTDNQG